jgi:multiple sugar transport system substrate-binding protein
MVVRVFYIKTALQTCLAFALVLSFSGCAGLPFFSPQEPVTLRFTYIENIADYAPLAEEFTRQNPNITIELDPAAPSRDTMRTLADKAKTADVIRLPSTFINEEIAAGFLPLDTILTTDQKFRPDDLFPNSLEGLRMAGKQVGIPAGINPMVMLYIPAKFEAAGVRPPPVDWVIDEFVNTAMAVSNADPSLVGSPQLTYGYCTHPDLPDSIMFSFVFGGGIFDNIYNPNRADLNSPENVNMLNWYASLKNDFGLVPDVNRLYDLGALIARGNCGFWMDWLDRSTFGQYGEFEVDMLPLPSYAVPFSVALIDSYSIMATSEHSEESWKWINFLLSQPTASGRLVPPSIAKISDPEFASQVDPDALVIAGAMPQQTAILGLEMYGDPRLGQTVELFSKAARQVMEGDMDAQSALDAAQQQADQAFNR